MQSGSKLRSEKTGTQTNTLPKQTEQLARRINTDILQALDELDSPMQETLILMGKTAKKTEDGNRITIDNLIREGYSQHVYAGDGIEQFGKICNDITDAVDSLAKIGLVNSSIEDKYEESFEKVRYLNLTLSGHYAYVLLTAMRRLDLNY